MLKRSRKAFTLVELMVATALAALLGYMVVQVLDSSAAAARSNIETSVAQTATRETVDELTRALSGIELTHECSASGSGGSCKISDSEALLRSTPQCMVFASRTGYGDGYAWGEGEVPENSAGVQIISSSITTHDLVVARVRTFSEGSTLEIDRYQYPSSTPNNTQLDSLCAPSAAPAANLIRSISVDAALSDNSAPEVFSYEDIDGDGITDVVQVAASFEGRSTRSGQVPFDLNFEVTLPASGYYSNGSN